MSAQGTMTRKDWIRVHRSLGVTLFLLRFFLFILRHEVAVVSLIWFGFVFGWILLAVVAVRVLS